MSDAIGAAPDAQKITESTQSQLQLSFASAEDLAGQNPQHADAITAAAKTSFLQGDDWAYTAGVAAVLLGAFLVFTLFPRMAEERRLLGEYHAEDTAGKPDLQSSPA
jgi:MFS transporter, DHA2 family, multidrug resistance protein